MSAPAATATQYPITSTYEKTSAFWGCRECKYGGRSPDAAIQAAKHRRSTNHTTFWEYHAKGNFPSIDAERALKVVPAIAKRKGPAVKLPKNVNPRLDRVAAAEKVRGVTAPNGLDVQELMQLLEITWGQANGLRTYWMREKTFRIERRAGVWRVFP